MFFSLIVAPPSSDMGTIAANQYSPRENSMQVLVELYTLELYC